MAHKKGVGSSRNGRDSNPKYLGVKRYGGEFVTAGSIIVIQRGTKFHPGKNVRRASNDSLFSVVDGHVKFEHKDKKRERGDLPATQADRFAGAAALPSDDRVTPPAHDGGLRAQQHDRDDEQGQRRGRGQSQLRRKLKQAPDLRGHRIDARR